MFPNTKVKYKTSLSELSTSTFVYFIMTWQIFLYVEEFSESQSLERFACNVSIMILKILQMVRTHIYKLPTLPILTITTSCNSCYI